MKSRDGALVHQKAECRIDTDGGGHTHNSSRQTNGRNESSSSCCWQLKSLFMNKADIFAIEFGHSVQPSSGSKMSHNCDN